jgi:hypothetical protein
VSQSIVAISSKFEHTQVGVYHRYWKWCILDTTIAAFYYPPFNMFSG